VKVGISFVSIDNALANLTAEIGDKNFAQTRGLAKQAWDAFFDKIKIEEDSVEKRTIFYTNFYHSLLHPNVFSDVNGQYLGFDDKVHQLPPGDVQYENISTWDGWRNQFPLQALIAPTQARDIVRSLLRDAQEDSGGGMPRWEQANQNSGGMVGDSPAIFIADASAYGVQDFDVNSAFDILNKAATDPKVTSGGWPVREHLEEYRSKGFVAEEKGSLFSASVVLEYCNDDFALSRLAQRLGKNDLAAFYLKEAQNWKNLYDPALGYLIPKSKDGGFLPNYKLGSADGFKEGTAQQYTWMVPFNFRGLFDLMGGNKAAVEKLQHLFTKLNQEHGDYAYMGNEPCNTCPWAYDFAGAPYLAQKTTRDVVMQLYQNAPGGLPGNDDGGAMTSWCLFASLGLFPEIPGVPGFVVGSPLFKQATITLPSGGLLRINAPTTTDQACYIQSLAIKKADYASPWIPWDLIKDGADLDFVMQPQPDISWGSDPTNAPPSFDVK
jgi:predicted alpha-1,2-mannosidase